MIGRTLWYDSLVDIVPDVVPDSIISRTLLNDDYANVTLFVFDAGQGLSEHRAKQTAILQILGGEADITLDGVPHLSREGAWTYMPPETPHSVSARTKLTMLLILLKA